MTTPVPVTSDAITDVRTRWLRIPLSPPLADSTHTLDFLDLILVEVCAGDFHGLSYMLSFDFAPALLRDVVGYELRRHLLGAPADDIRGIYDRAFQVLEYAGQEGVGMWGIAAIDTALWDLQARKLGVPVSRILGRRQGKVPIYGSGGWLSYTDEQLADETSRYVARGFAGVKLKIGGASEERDIDRVRYVRSVIGPDKLLMIDANQGLTLDRALRTARRLEDQRLQWLEEPFHRGDLESYRRLAAATEIPLAAGEREFGAAPFRTLLETGAVSVTQPDLMRVGGVTGWRLVAGLTELHRRRLAPHFYKEYDIHLAACTPNVIAIESFDWLDPLVRAPLQVVDGDAIVPDAPGFGFEFRPEVISEFEVS